MSKFYHFISLYILMFFLLPRNSRPLDPHVQACTPRMCGALTIRFPFYIEGPQEPYCGYPGFNVSCYNNQTAIHLSDDSYVIQNISYEDQSLRIVNSAFLDEVFDCFPSIHNFTLDDDSMFSSKYGEIFLFYNCRDPKLPKSPTYKEMICEHEGKRGMVVAVYDHDFMGYGKMPYECQGVVTVPYRGEDGSDIEGVMRKGLVLNWQALNCSACVDSGGFCGYNGSTSESKCYCPDGVHRRSCHPGEQERMEKEPEKKGPGKRKLKLILGLAIPGGILLLLAAILFWCRKQLRLGSTRFLRRTISSDTEKSDLENDGMYFNVPIFTYKELEEATNKFDGARELGDGGFGTVYYGKLKDGREVAVKRLYERNYKRVEQFMNEVEILTHLRHPNLVSLYGCTSRHCRNLILVYEYVPNGTLSDHLYGDPAQSQVLPWATRLRIAIETATALSYLHTSGIIHRDVKTNNILLDNNFSVKVADFGLSRLFPTDVTHVSTAPQGTPGYLDPEYYQCYQLTDKSDVYSFGVVLIELISSLPAVDINRHRHEINLSNYAMNRIQQSAFEELVDPQLGFKSDYRVQKTTTKVAELAFQCLQNDKDFRPTMDEVVQALKSIESTDFVVSWDTKNEDVESLKPVSEDTETEDVGSLKNMKKLASASSVEDQWTSTNTTPSTSN